MLALAPGAGGRAGAALLALLVLLVQLVVHVLVLVLTWALALASALWLAGVLASVLAMALGLMAHLTHLALLALVALVALMALVVQGQRKRRQSLRRVDYAPQECYRYYSSESPMTYVCVSLHHGTTYSMLHRLLPFPRGPESGSM